MPLAWNPATGPCRGPFAVDWAGKQPLVELLVAGLRLERGEVKRLAKQGGLSYFWWRAPTDEEWVRVFTRYGKRELIASYCVEAVAALKRSDLVVWLPIATPDLFVAIPFEPGVLVVRTGKHRLTRIGLTDETR